MALRLADIITRAAFRADLSVTTPSTSDRVQQYEWAALAVEATKAVWVLAAGARPDFQVTFSDFTVTSGGSASFTCPNDMHGVIDVVYGPDTTSEYSLGPFAWQNRRSPGGWFPANFGGSTNLGGNSIRLMGNTIYIEPSMRAGGTYRLWYCPKQKLSGPFVVRVAALSSILPAFTGTGAGVGHALIANANGALPLQDGTSLVVGDRILLYSAAGSVNDGIYTVTSLGSAGSPWVLTRATDYDQASDIAVGDVIVPTAGSNNANHLFQLSFWGGTVDGTAGVSTFGFVDGAVLDAVLDPFGELIEILTALPAVIRDDDLDPRQLQLRAYGQDGNSGLVGDLKAYFKQVRTAYGPGKMVDCDNRGPRSPWNL